MTIVTAITNPAQAPVGFANYKSGQIWLQPDLGILNPVQHY